MFPSGYQRVDVYLHMSGERVDGECMLQDGMTKLN